MGKERTEEETGPVKGGRTPKSGDVIMLVLSTGAYVACRFVGFLVQEGWISVIDPIHIFRVAAADGTAQFAAEPYVIMSSERNVLIPIQHVVTIIPSLDEPAIKTYYANVKWIHTAHKEYMAAYEAQKEHQFKDPDQAVAPTPDATSNNVVKMEFQNVPSSNTVH